jgi:hypothetical protein
MNRKPNSEETTLRRIMRLDAERQRLLNLPWHMKTSKTYEQIKNVEETLQGLWHQRRQEIAVERRGDDHELVVRFA